MQLFKVSGYGVSTKATVRKNPIEVSMSFNHAIHFTPAALAHVKNWLTKNPAAAVRLHIDQKGCSGFKYEISLAEIILESDERFLQADQETFLVVDKQVLSFVKGTIIDYVRNGLNSQFKFLNPNEAGSCGCGESFTV